jgi:tRNA(fMet)-specific endonuclease VapC
VKPRYLLDTNICIYLLKGAPDAVLARFSGCSVGEVVMSSITCAELEFGGAISANPEGERAALAALLDAVPVVALDVGAAQAYAVIRKASRERRADALDKLIAAHAVALGVVLVTNNEGDFRRYPGVVVENWVGG